MVKQYVGQHEVEYRGTYDGEGLMWGEWHIGPLTDRWMIKLKGARTPTTKQTDIAEIASGSRLAEFPQHRHPARRHPFDDEDVAVLVEAGVVRVDELAGCQRFGLACAS